MGTRGRTMKKTRIINLKDYWVTIIIFIFLTILIIISIIITFNNWQAPPVNITKIKKYLYMITVTKIKDG